MSHTAMEEVMFVRIIERVPGNHREIGKTKMDAIPRQGESVIINDTSMTVHSVTWNLTEMSVIILVE